MSASPSLAEHFSKRNEDRASLLTDGKRDVDEKNNEVYKKQQDEHRIIIELEQEKAGELVKKQVDELKEARAKNTEEWTRVQAEISANLKKQQELRSEVGREEVEKSKRALAEKNRELEAKARLLKEQLDESLRILEEGEQKRQEAVKEMNSENLEDKKTFNEELLKHNIALHEKKLATESKLMKVDEANHAEEIKLLERSEEKRMGAFSQVQQLTQSLSLQDSFQSFKQQCDKLRRSYGKFTTEYFDLEETLLSCDRRMSIGKPIKEYDMDDLKDALRLFRVDADGFSAQGSTDELEFGTLIGELIKIITVLTNLFNDINSKIDLYTEEETKESDKKGIMEELVGIKENLGLMSTLIQRFNVIPRDHFAETLHSQMEAIRAPNNHVHAIENHPSSHNHTPTLAIE